MIIGCILFVYADSTRSLLNNIYIPFAIFYKTFLTLPYRGFVYISKKCLAHKTVQFTTKYEIYFNFCVILKILGVAASRIFNFCISVSVLALFILLAFSIRPQAVKIRKNKESGEPLSLLWSIYNSIRY